MEPSAPCLCGPALSTEKSSSADGTQVEGSMSRRSTSASGEQPSLFDSNSNESDATSSDAPGVIGSMCGDSLREEDAFRGQGLSYRLESTVQALMRGAKKGGSN